MTQSVIANAWTLWRQNHINLQYPSLALMFDYDGTLTPIADKPSNAILGATQVELLTTLARHPHTRMAVVTGRAVEHLRPLAPALFTLPIFLCGHHGGEMVEPLREGEDNFLAANQKGHERYVQEVDSFYQQLVGLMSQNVWDDSGILLERKPMSVALHYRLASEALHCKVQGAMESLWRSNPHWKDMFRLQAGKSVIEFLPKSFQKGGCVELLLQRWEVDGPVFPCFIGDDNTDESAFRVVNGRGGLSIAVGKIACQTDARVVLPSVEGVFNEISVLLENLNLVATHH